MSAPRKLVGAAQFGPIVSLWAVQVPTVPACHRDSLNTELYVAPGRNLLLDHLFRSRPGEVEEVGVGEGLGPGANDILLRWAG
jgi:hypothetical protein